jgi:replicative DNA helicase
MDQSIKMKELFCRPSDERALLSFCMHDLTSYFAVCARLDASDFLYSQHETLMLLLYSLAAKGSERFDANLIIAEASSQDVLNDIGGIKYIQAIDSMNPSPSNFEIYLNSAVEATTKYKLYKLLDEKLSILKENSKEGLMSADILGSIESSVMDLSMSGFNINEPIDLAEGLDDYLNKLRNIVITLSGLSTGYPILDKQIDGMVPGTLLVVAARKKMGKSALLTNIAAHVAYRLDKPVLYVDTELSFNEWRSRALAIISGVKERDIKHGGYDEITFGKLQKCSKLITKGKLFHEYMPGYSVDKLVALYKKYKYKEKIGLIVFDYFKEPDSSSVSRQRKEYQILGDITTKLKDLAGQLDIPALTAVQLNRDNDVADSDRIARYADVICHWGQRDNKDLDTGGKESGTHKLVIKDTRRGGATDANGIGYFFFKETLNIREVPIDKQYFTNFKNIVNEDSAGDLGDYEGYEDEELS